MDKINTRDWAKTFGSINPQVVYQSQRYYEFAMEVAEPGLASGFARTIGLSGFTLDEVMIRSGNTLVIADIEEKESIRTAYMISGKTDSLFDFSKKSAVMEKSRHAFQYSPGFEAEHKVVTGDFRALHINVDPDFFKSIMADNDSGMDKLCESIIKEKPFQSFHFLQPRMIQIINNILQCPFVGITRYLFIESKVLELLALQMDQMNPRKNVKEAAPGKDDVAKFWAVKEYIENNYLEALSLTGLCKMFLLNEFKLKRGYKQLFQTTVFGHIYSLRMEKARELLFQGSMNISEIADFIGYQNIGSFSAEFKKRFGYAPSKFCRDE